MNISLNLFYFVGGFFVNFDLRIFLDYGLGHWAYGPKLALYKQNILSSVNLNNKAK